MHIPLDLLKNNDRHFFLSEKEIQSCKKRIERESALQLDGEAQMQRRMAMLSKAAPEAVEVAFERYIGNNDLLPINYFLIGYIKSKAVGRLRYFDLNVKKDAMASAFLITPNLILTNHHVLTGKEDFRDAQVDFDYAYDITGAEMTKIVFEIDAHLFFYTHKDLDFSIVGIKEQDLTGSHRIKDRGYLVLNPDKGKIGTGDSATIIQYPEGAYQQVALRDNKILDITRPDALIYQTDTAPGTSGSPVFNDQWQVIALHSAGVGKKNAADDYIDKNGNKIPVVNGTIDSTQIIWISNTGIRISSLMEAIRADTSINNNPLIQDLFAPSYTDNKRNIQSMALPETIIHQNTNTPAVSIATDTVQPNVTININIGGATPKSIVVSLQQQPHPPAAQVQIATPDIFDEAYESKINAEANADYAACLGFDENFMGFKTPIPALNRQLRRQVACLKENSNAYILKYDHYSTIFHSIRRVPVVSMINVEGNPNERQDKTTRQDNWLRDNRIDLDIQLNDNYYSKSGFDKGHLSRREDAKWGNTPEEAEVAAQMTCRYTNACPQVPELNRAIMGYHGLWGTLEQIVLEKGVTKETGKSSKICVYNGPIFVDTDPTYKGVQVAMRFFKIIVWRNGKNKKKATAFVLSQEDLVGGIQFEELQFDKEFIEHQCSIAYIEKLTGLTFKTIRNYDTSPKANDKNAVGKIDSAGVENLISSHA